MHSPERFRQKILAWYRQHKRDLPWRKSRDPYRIWISEIMLQQTQVKTVLPYYVGFLSRFPDIGSLADAEEREVVAHWSGLGYYARARNLHRAARRIRDDGGSFPRRFARILALPGVGRYTAGAIASIAFGARYAVVDGNVRRVLTRYFGEAMGEAECWRVAESLLPQRHTGDYNQALMEIGATICRREQPFCLLCPLARDCRTQGGELPRRRKSVDPTPQTMVLLLLRKRGKFWLEPRDQSHKLLKNLWCLPMEYGDVAMEGLRLRLLRRFSLSGAEVTGSFKHSIMKYRFHTSVAVASYRGNRPGRGAWVGVEELGEYPHSSIVKKALAVFQRG